MTRVVKNFPRIPRYGVKPTHYTRYVPQANRQRPHMLHASSDSPVVTLHKVQMMPATRLMTSPTSAMPLKSWVFGCSSPTWPSPSPLYLNAFSEVQSKSTIHSHSLA